LQLKEYERRRRSLEEQLHEDLELIRAAHQARLRALENLWLASNGEDLPDASNVTLASAETGIRQDLPASVPPSEPAELRKMHRGDALEDILKAFPNLPEVFDKSDAVRLIGYEPSRPALHRVWSRLQQQKKIVIETYSDGRRPQRFRKVGGG
jgi:hypothetical protein